MQSKSWTKLSLYYLFGYLSVTGVGLMAMPTAVLQLLGSTATYDDTFTRLVGAFMIVLATLVAQMIRFELKQLYPTTIAIRVFFISTIIWLYTRTNDPAFLMILGVVCLGLFLTLLGFGLERKQALRSRDVTDESFNFQRA